MEGITRTRTGREMTLTRVMLLATGLGLIANFVFLSIVHSSYIVIVPTFTASAYQPNGFYYYYSHKCDTHCLTVPVNQDNFNTTIKYADTFNAQIIFAILGFKEVTDEQVTNNPPILENKTVILLHNEYVSQSEYNAVVSHKYIRFYPNALYALVDYRYNSTNYTSNNVTVNFPITTITLVGDRTHEFNYWTHIHENITAEKTFCKFGTEPTFGKENKMGCWMQDPIDIAYTALRLP